MFVGFERFEGFEGMGVRGPGAACGGLWHPVPAESCFEGMGVRGPGAACGGAPERKSLEPTAWMLGHLEPSMM